MRDAIIDGATGQLVPVGDAKALAETMATYLSDPELATRHDTAALSQVERAFAQEKVFESSPASTARPSPPIPIPPI